MSRKTFPRTDEHHARAATQVFLRHSVATGTNIELPVPIEMIIEKTYDLRVESREMEESEGEIILGALVPRDRTVWLNSIHQDLFDEVIGPERFTLAHELAHWIYDADSPDQLVLDLNSEVADIYCYHRESPGLTETLRIREMNANKLAAHILMPEDLVRQAYLNGQIRDLTETARDWGVSLASLRIRLDTMGIIHPEG